MAKQLYPKAPKPEPDHSDRSWAIRYEDVIYDNGVFSWTKYYRTKLGARFFAWWTIHIASWGGGASLIDNRGNHG